MHFFSPCKINLFFHVVRKREDGYHDIVSVLQTLSFGDTITIEPSHSDQLSCSDETLPMDSRNLVVQAIDLFRNKTEIRTPIALHLEKKVPQQAGLGGGSGNAATTLWALNHLFCTNLSNQELISLAASLGSDTAFFLSGGTALCQGRGELLTSLPPIPKQDLWIVKPQQGLSTPLVYKTLQVKEQQRDIDVIITNYQSGQFSYFNDLEEPAFTLMPELSSVKKSLLDQGASHALLCGSGSALFCLGLEKAPVVPSHCQVYHCSFVNREESSWYNCC
jgi:4-diphosphocytidyl-2-C-methyl-D-erythritol kinase